MFSKKILFRIITTLTLSLALTGAVFAAEAIIPDSGPSVSDVAYSVYGTPVTESAVEETPAPMAPPELLPISAPAPVPNSVSVSVPVSVPVPVSTSTVNVPITQPVKDPVVKGASVAPKPTKIINHSVQKGETLFFISKKFVSSIFAIKTTNNLKSDYLYIGQFLKIPSFAVTPTATNPTKYTVKKGDTLYLISKKFGVTIASIKTLSKLKSAYLYVGQVLTIKYAPSNTVNSGSRPSVASRYDASRSETLLLARLIFAESRGESYNGQLAVGAVVMNRVHSSLFPNTISGVIYQKNEFSAVLDGQVNLNPDVTAMKASEDALKGIDPTGGALFYWNPTKAPNNTFLNSKAVITTIGNHVFAK